MTQTKRSIRFVLGMLTAVFVLTAPSLTSISTLDVAYAQEQDLEKAKKRFGEGKQAFQAGEFKEAAEAFLDAYQYSGRSELLYNVGQSYRKVGKLRLAEKYFQQYLEEKPDAENADKVVEKIIAIQDEMAKTMATVEVETTPPGTNIFVDAEDEARCQSPCSVSLLPGEHTVVARDSQGGEASKPVTVEPQQQASLELELEGQTRTGELEIMTDVQSGTVEIAGQSTVSLPMASPIEIPAGQHDVTVSSGGKTWTGTVDVVANQTRRILVPLSSVDSGGGGSVVQSASYGLLGASIGLLTGGILLGNQASKTHGALQQQQDNFGAVDSGMVDRGKSQQTGANIMFGASAVTFTAGASLLVWDMLSSNESTEKQPAPSQQPSDEGGDSDSADVDLLGSN